jgi:hypothetical protein
MVREEAGFNKYYSVKKFWEMNNMKKIVRLLTDCVFASIIFAGCGANTKINTVGNLLCGQESHLG